MGNIAVLVGTNRVMLAVDIPPISGQPFRALSGGNVAGIKLVDPSDPNATPIHCKVGGIVKAWMGAILITDTFVDGGATEADTNYSTEDNVSVFDYQGGDGPVGVQRLIRAFIKAAPNKTLHLYQKFVYDNAAEITVKEVDPATFDIATVTWNTKPATGATITTFTPTNATGWYSFLTGTTGAICLLLTSETVLSYGAMLGSAFSSMEDTDPTKRPYVT